MVMSHLCKRRFVSHQTDREQEPIIDYLGREREERLHSAFTCFNHENSTLPTPFHAFTFCCCSDVSKTWTFDTGNCCFQCSPLVSNKLVFPNWNSNHFLRDVPLPGSTPDLPFLNTVKLVEFPMEGQPQFYRSKMKMETSSPLLRTLGLGKKSASPIMGMGLTIKGEKEAVRFLFARQIMC
jgi:hypothetical protein